MSYDIENIMETVTAFRQECKGAKNERDVAMYVVPLGLSLCGIVEQLLEALGHKKRVDNDDYS
jgi:hypothetical protein